MIAQRYAPASDYNAPRSPLPRDSYGSAGEAYLREPKRTLTGSSAYSNVSNYGQDDHDWNAVNNPAAPKVPFLHQNYSTPTFAVGQQPYAAESLSPDDLQIDRLRLAADDGSGAPWLPEDKAVGAMLEHPSRASTSSAGSAEMAAWRDSHSSAEDDRTSSITDPYGGLAGSEIAADHYGAQGRTPLASTSHLRTESGGTLNQGYYPVQGPSSQDGHFSQEQYYRTQSFGSAHVPYEYSYGTQPQQQQQQQWPPNAYYGQMAYPADVYSQPMAPTPYALQRNMSVSSNLTTGSAGLSRHGSTMPGGGKAGKAKLNPTGKERTITKSAIDEYRNRIKADPDPESQFNFAKFLIEAARKLAQMAQQTSESSRARDMKKYRDALLQEAIKLIKRLATQSQGTGKPAYADAQFFLADCLSSGSLGLQVDHEKAYNLYVQASKQNHAPATYRTAVCNEGGHGTKRDASRAVLFYRKASALGNTPGMYKLGMILLNGLLGQPKNGKESVTWLRRAAAQADEENPHALHELGQLYERPPNPNAPSGPGPTVVEDPPQAFELYQQAARLGYGLSQYKLGMAYEYGNLGCPVDPRRSVAYYTVRNAVSLTRVRRANLSQRAAERNVADAELALSGWYLTGAEGVLNQSDQEAYLWARRAANRGLPRGEFAVGYYEEAGIGCKRDIEEAKRWYMRAAAQGNKRAMQRLTELKKQANSRVSKKPTREQTRDECIIS